jgi:hypothetical protein
MTTMHLSLTAAIASNRRRWERFNRAILVQREVRLRIFEYEDAGKGDKAQRLLERCKRTLAPLWVTRHHRVVEEES